MTNFIWELKVKDDVRLQIIIWLRVSLNTCISYLNKIFTNFPHLLETCSVYNIFKYKSAISCLISDNICSQSPLNFKILLCQKITVKISSSHYSSLAKDKSNVHCVVPKLSFVLQMSFSFFNELCWITFHSRIS